MICDLWGCVRDWVRDFACLLTYFALGGAGHGHGLVWNGVAFWQKKGGNLAMLGNIGISDWS